jgi:hypothetical protein
LETVSVKVETLLQAAFLKAQPFAIPSLRLFRRNVAKVRVEGRMVSFGIKGQSDLYGVLRGGRHIELELKSATGKPRKGQKEWQAWCEAWGVLCLILKQRTGESVDETVARWLHELSEALSS